MSFEALVGMFFLNAININPQQIGIICQKQENMANIYFCCCYFCMSTGGCPIE